MVKLTVNNRHEFTASRFEGKLIINNIEAVADTQKLSAGRFHVIHRLRSYNVEIVSYDEAVKTAEIKVNNNTYYVSAKDQFDLLLDQLGMSNLTSAKFGDLKAPMPGLVLKVFVNEGDEVKKGENLFILEAMKMENIIKAPADLIIKSVKLKSGDKVEKGQVLLAFN